MFIVPGDDPAYGVIKRDDLTLHLRKRPDAAGTLFCYLVVENAQQWFDESMAKGASFRRRIATSSDGMRDFELLDGCGNVIGIGEPSR